MELHWNGEMIDPQAGETAIESALDRLRLEGNAKLELRRQGAGCMRVLHGPDGGFLLEVEEGRSLFGLLVPEDALDELGAALLEFRRGSRPRLPQSLLQAKGSAELAEFVAGDDSEHDCPLCALLAAAI